MFRNLFNSIEVFYTTVFLALFSLAAVFCAFLSWASSFVFWAVLGEPASQGEALLAGLRDGIIFSAGFGILLFSSSRQKKVTSRFVKPRLVFCLGLLCVLLIAGFSLFLARDGASLRSVWVGAFLPTTFALNAALRLIRQMTSQGSSPGPKGRDDA